MQYLALFAVSAIWCVVLTRLAISLGYQHAGSRETLDEALAYGYDFLAGDRRATECRARLVARCGGEGHQAVELFDTYIVGQCHIPSIVPVRYSDAASCGFIMVTAMASAAILCVSLVIGAAYAVVTGGAFAPLAGLLHLAGIAAGLSIFSRTRGACSYQELTLEVRQRNGKNKQPRSTPRSWYHRLVDHLDAEQVEHGQ